MCYPASDLALEHERGAKRISIFFLGRSTVHEAESATKRPFYVESTFKIALRPTVDHDLEVGNTKTVLALR